MRFLRPTAIVVESIIFRGVMQPPVVEGGCMTPRNVMLSQSSRAQKSRGYQVTISIGVLVSAQDRSLDTISGRAPPSLR